MKSDAIEELFRKYYNDALLYLISLTGNVAIAEEMVSTAFFKALKTADGAIKDFKPWLLKVCRNIFLSHCRAKKRYVELNENIPDRNESAIEKVIRNEDYRALYRAIGLLPEGQKEAVTLYYFEGLSVKEIAEITGKSAEGVKVSMYRARENLKKIMEVDYGI